MKYFIHLSNTLHSDRNAIQYRVARQAIYQLVVGKIIDTYSSMLRGDLLFNLTLLMTLSLVILSIVTPAMRA